MLGLILLIIKLHNLAKLYKYYQDALAILLNNKIRSYTIIKKIKSNLQKAYSALENYQAFCQLINAAKIIHRLQQCFRLGFFLYLPLILRQFLTRIVDLQRLTLFALVLECLNLCQKVMQIPIKKIFTRVLAGLQLLDKSRYCLTLEILLEKKILE